MDEDKVAYEYLDGSTKDRLERVDHFQADDGPPVFLISLKAGGSGLNLTAADTVIHFDPWWNPAVEDQATDRAYRIGQRKPVFVHSLYVAGSVEERVIALQGRKRWLSSAVLGDESVGAVGENEIEELFAPLEG
jgi:SNF2 family DNA or RNA helicase